MTAADAVDSSPDPLSAGRAALHRREWAEARLCFQAALDAEQTPEALEGLARAAWYLGDETTVFDGRERAYRLYLECGDRVAAARVATALATDSVEFRGEPAVASGWLRRAGRLLEGQALVPEHAWLAVWEAHLTLMLDNAAAAARRRAAEGVAIAREVGATDPEILGLAVEGLAAVCEGDTASGLRLLDEAAAAAMAGEVGDLNAAGTVFCYLMDACGRVRDFDRAAQWCERVRHWALQVGWGEMFGACRPHYALVLMWRGAWDEAERQLEASHAEISASRPPMAIEAVVRLAELRWRQGRWDEAAALFREVEHDGLSQLGRAELALDRGDAREALDLAERALRRIPPDDRIERGPALELKVRALAALGDPVAAEPALGELQAIAMAAAVDPLRAGACLAAGVLAASRGEHAAALGCLEDAVDYYFRSGAVFEGARARMRLARTLLALGRIERVAREASEALQAFRRLGAAREAVAAEALLRDIARSVAPAPARDPLADDSGLTPREKEVLALIATGRTNSEIAQELVLSVRTVERHISNIYEKLGVNGKVARAAAVAFALRRGIVPAQPT